jgi:DNA-binding response OmpR family regulator
MRPSRRKPAKTRSKWATAANWRIDMVVADYRLGAGLSGVATAREIAGRAGHAFPTLVLTGDTAKDRIAEIAASGFEMLHKPVNADVLRRKLAELMESRLTLATLPLRDDK